jgi:hypothetical protein
LLDGQLTASSIPSSELRADYDAADILKHLPLLDETVRILLNRHKDARDTIKIIDTLRLRKIKAQARYVQSHEHSDHCFSAKNRMIINLFLGSPGDEHIGLISHILEDRRVEPSISLNREEYTEWSHGLTLAGYRGKFQKLMDPDFIGHPIVSSVHEQLNEFLSATAHLEGYILN